MKELIEKIKELRQKPYSEYERLSHNKAVDEVLNIIQEQESKPFNPVELGFEVEFNKEGQKEYFLRYKNGYYKLEAYNQDNFFRLSTYIKHKPEFAHLGYPSTYKEYITIKIPSHRFGVELLRNLGVIE